MQPGLQVPQLKGLLAPVVPHMCGVQLGLTVLSAGGLAASAVPEVPLHLGETLSHSCTPHPSDVGLAVLAACGMQLGMTVPSAAGLAAVGVYYLLVQGEPRMATTGSICASNQV